MANAPHNGPGVELHIRHRPGGKFTDHVFGAGATRMKERDILRFEGPFGSFFMRDDSTKPVIFPSDHGGFLGGEYGQTGEPDAFAAKLREVLTGEA